VTDQVTPVESIHICILSSCRVPGTVKRRYLQGLALFAGTEDVGSSSEVVPNQPSNSWGEHYSVVVWSDVISYLSLHPRDVAVHAGTSRLAV
jgi:hypothetical protein